MMGVAYDPKYGLRRISYSCGAKVGDIVTAYDRSYEVIGCDDYGCYVCRNLDENCLANDELRTFDDLDIDEVIPPTDDRFVGCGAGI